jgi:hypothetical protein
MGSPYKTCNLHLAGEWVPDLEQGDWVAVQAHSPDGRYLVLAKWDTAKNTPGFRVVLINEVQKTVNLSQRILGCCESLGWQTNAIAWKAFPQSQGNIAIPFDKLT